MIHYIADIMRGINSDNIPPYMIADHGRHLIGSHTLATHITAYNRHYERLQDRLMVMYLADMKRLQGRLMDDIGVYGIGYIIGYNTL